MTLNFYIPEEEVGLKAFPSAEGFGAASEGPRGAGTTPTIYHVTSLSDANTPGTFRYACQQTGPRFVVFDVAGTSVAASEILIDSPYIYIAGQTAPNGGFCVRAAAGYKLTVLSIATQHVIIRHIRIRAGFQADQYPSPTAGSAGDNSTCVNHKHLVGGRYCQHIIWDHCSITWGTDGNMQSGHDAKDLTIQRCIISKPLMNAGHSQQPHGRPLNHQYSEDEGNPDDIGTDYGEFSHIRISDHHNIMSHGEERFPQISTGTGWVELTNNVIYRTRDLATQVNTNGNNIPGATKARIVGNYYKTTNTSTANYEINLTPDPDDRLPDCKVYVYGNVGENRPTDTESHWLSMAPWGRSPAMGGTADGINPDPTTVTDRLCHTDGKPDFPEADIPITETTAAAAYADLVTGGDCGATLPMLDAVDTEIIAEVAANSGTWIDHPGQREDPDDISFDGGYPDLTTGGSSSLWSEPADQFEVAANGYLNVENDLNELAGDTIP